MENKKEYHILSLSGGKDSTALAFFMKENMPEIFEKLELVFCDTEHEIPETYDYLNKIEVFLNKKIHVVKPERSFEHIYQIYNQIPSITRRWCTVELKTKPFRNFIKKSYSDRIVNMYIGIRADEIRRIDSSRSSITIKEKHPFIEYNIKKDDVLDILNNAGIGLPKYYEWSNRSGCYFCPFQTKLNWLNLYEKHPDLFKKAMSYEFEEGQGKKTKDFGWIIGSSLKELIKPENINLIKEKYKKKNIKCIVPAKLIEVF